MDDRHDEIAKREKPVDGEYEFEVTDIGYREPQGRGVFDFEAKIISDGPYNGHLYKRAYFRLKKDGTENTPAIEAFRQLLSDLGFDVKAWTKANGRPFSQEFEKASVVAIGMRFRGRLKRSGDDGQYETVYVNKRLPDGKPEKFDAASLAAAAEAAEKAVPF